MERTPMRNDPSGTPPSPTRRRESAVWKQMIQKCSSRAQAQASSRSRRRWSVVRM
jgi:hypothetical protein